MTNTLFGTEVLPPTRVTRMRRVEVLFRPMSDIERARVEALKNVSYLPGTRAKRFARDINQHLMACGATITDRQAGYVEQLTWKFRRQMPTAVVPAVKPEGA